MISRPLLLLLSLSLLVTAPKATNIATGALQTASDAASGTRGCVADGAGVGALLGSYVSIASRLTLLETATYRVVLPTALSAVHALFGESVSDALQSAALA